MSFHNRLLLNRAMLAGLRSIEVLVLLEASPASGYATAGWTELARHVERAGGRLLRTERDIGYARIAVAPERLLELARAPAIAAYQISSLSRGAWYRDGPPLANAQMFRDYEVTPVAATEPATSHPHLPVLTPDESRAPGFTADIDVGVGTWMGQHPTYDGRGVTIAVLESALPSFTDPVFGAAKTLDGRDVPKIAGILNAIPPEHPDETRVLLDRDVHADTSWALVGNRTYVLPRPGTYRLGLLKVPAGGNVVHQFAIVEHATTREIWIDANGNASFQDERPLVDVNERFDPRFLTVSVPRRAEVSFVMSRGAAPRVVHIYLGRSSHQSMTASVAAGNRSDDSLASGVAPNARLLFVRMNAATDGLGKIIEGFIEAARHPIVDVLTASTGLALVPDTARDFLGLLFSRLTAVYDKPIVSSAGNFGNMLAHVHSHGRALSVGGTLGPETYEALYGGRRLPRLFVHPASASGPSIDGAIKPDFLAPVERIAANPPWESDLQAVPLNAPARRVPPGYEISCCTSASSPYAAGVIALLISAARQAGVPYTAARISRSLRATARPIPGFQAHEQGNGALDISGAWRELAGASDPPRITATAPIVHPLAQYAADGGRGHGIFEVEGWAVGQVAMRQIRLRRETGAAAPLTYTLRWSADDGTFRTPESIVLPLGVEVGVPVQVTIRNAGAHSGLLTLHDPDTGAVVFRTQATVVAANRVDPRTDSLQITDTVALMRENAHYVHVPPGTRAIALTLEVIRGVVQPGLTRSHGLISSYYLHVHPMEIFTVGKGTYHVLLPDPQPGTWAVRLANVSATRAPNLQLGPRDDGDAEYRIRMRLLSADIRATTGRDGVSLAIENTGGDLAEAAVEAWPATMRSHRGEFRRDGLANAIQIEVPVGAAALSLDLRSAAKAELFLYDCTTGECFSYDVAFPASAMHRLLVRRPTPGRWVAAVNAAPFPAGAGSFILDEVIATGTAPWRKTRGRLPRGASWSETVDTATPSAGPIDGRVPVVLFQLLDLAAERLESSHPWSSHPKFVKLRDRPVAVGTTIYRR